MYRPSLGRASCTQRPVAGFFQHGCRLITACGECKALEMASVQLTHGTTEYELEGPEGGPLVVLFMAGPFQCGHGIARCPPLSALVFGHCAMTCTARASQPTPRSPMTGISSRVSCLTCWSDLALKDPVHLVGFSFGGATATNFTAAHPDKVRTLALIAPVFRFEEGNTLVRTARIPLVGELFMRFVVMKKGADRASRLWSGAEGAEHYAALFRNQLSGRALSRRSCPS